jgi:(1->4)-alpha-D-glucan 1-alpha-D-glucosylmutase
VLKAGGIKVVRRGNKFQVECSGQRLPASPTSLPVILARAAEYAKSDALNFLAASFGRLPQPEYVDRRTILARHRDKVVLFNLLERLCMEERGVDSTIDRSVKELNGNEDGLDDFLNQQNYRLAYWKTADQQLSYRRFFDVNSLIGLRVEREYVFEETHALVLDWLKRGVIDGVRVDHPDGLRDPLEYLKRLREKAPDAYIVGEKILEPGEFLRDSWPIQGTTGYDFLNVAAGVLVAPEGMDELTSVYRDFTEQSTDFHAIAHEKKIGVTQEGLGSDVNRLTTLFVEICEENRDRRDYTRAEVRRAIREVAACFAIYRTYVVPERDEITDEDREQIAKATECAKQQRLDIDGGLFDFLRDVLTMEVKGKQESEFLLRFQQFTGPVMAKGVEDTAFYCYNRLTGMNEVGSDPGRNGLSVEEFHAYCTKMQKTHPLTMTALSTHDTKRSDDVRARLAVISEIPGRFKTAVQRWSRMNSPFRTKRPGGEAMPDRNTEYLYYQTLIGAWPLTMERAQSYMLKAVREAKQQTTWVANNKEFEEALRLFVELTMNYAPFLRELQQMVDRVRDAGRVNSLTQTLLKYTAPGVPDLYQGGEIWDLSLVDPDNRRPVDYGLRKKLLCELKRMTGEDVAAQVMLRADEGLPKMWTIHKALGLRRERPDCFGAEAEYTPLEVDGAKHDHVIAYLRGEDVVTVAPRLTLKLDGAWKDTIVVLPKGRWRNRLTGGAVAGGVITMRLLLKDFPVALLVREGAGEQD